MARKEYTGGAAPAKLTAGITSSPTTVPIDTSAGWPVGTYPFIAVIDRGVVGKEEKKRFSARSGETLTVDTGGNGVDGTAAVAHDAGATIEHCLDAESLTDFARHVYDTTSDDHTQYLNNARHDITGRHTFGAALGTPGTPAAVSTAAAAGSGAAPAREDHVHALNSSVAGDGLLLSGGVLFVNIDGSSLEIATDIVRVRAAGVAGAGLIPDGVSGVQVNVDNATLEVAADTVRVKDAGITKQKLAAAMQLPSGALMPFAGSAAPTGWLLCAGQAVSRSTYADLFAAIGTTYGTGDGSTTFNLPDLRGRIPVGLDNMNGVDAGRLDVANTLGGTGGEQKHVLTESEMPSHEHAFPSGVSVPTFGFGSGFSNASGIGADPPQTVDQTATAGSDAAHNNMQPYVLTNWLIKE